LVGTSRPCHAATPLLAPPNLKPLTKLTINVLRYLPLIFVKSNELTLAKLRKFGSNVSGLTKLKFFFNVCPSLVIGVTT